MSTLYSPNFLAAEAENFSLKFGCFVDVALLLASAAIIFLTGCYLVKTIYYVSRRPRNGAEKAKTIAWIGLFFETGLALLAKFFVIPFIYGFTNPTAPLEFKQLVADFIFFTNMLCNGILFFAATVIIYFAAKRLLPIIAYWGRNTFLPWYKNDFAPWFLNVFAPTVRENVQLAAISVKDRISDFRADVPRQKLEMIYAFDDELDQIVAKDEAEYNEPFYRPRPFLN